MTTRHKRIYMALILISAGLLRLSLISSPGNQGDLEWFFQWSHGLEKYGLSNFYASMDFADYPPGYLYILCALGYLFRYTSCNHYILLKLPAILFDLITIAVFLHLLFRSDMHVCHHIAALFFAFNPMSIYNSAVYGQVESVLTLCLVLTLYAMYTKRYELAAALYALAFLIKPQAIIIGPAILFAAMVQLRQNWKYWLRRLFLCIGIFFLVFYLLSLPFSGGRLNPLWLLDLYKNTMLGYNQVSLNAYNFWWMLNIHWVDSSLMFGPLSYKTWGYLMVCTGLLLCGWLHVHQTEPARIFSTAAIFYSIFFMVCCCMHERYLYPAAILFFFSYLLCQKRLYLLAGIGLSIQNFWNQYGSLHWEGILHGLRRSIALAGVLIVFTILILMLAGTKRTTSSSPH